MLAQGDVTIAGVVNVSALVNCPSGSCNCEFIRIGPGGFFGGRTGPGFGPGGGTSSHPSGSWVGPLSLTPIIGGSGAAYVDGLWGGDGGGAIVIASSTSI